MNFRNKTQNIRLFPQNAPISGQNSYADMLRKITKQDTFPCFTCFDEPEIRINCQTCDKLGFIPGDHPMVLFVDDFLSKTLPEQMKTKAQYMDGQSKRSQVNSQLSDDEKSLFISNNKLINRKQCRSAIQSYGSQQQEVKVQAVPKAVMRSVDPKAFEKQIVHIGFQCNGCNCNPIKGKRYHCSQCEDYDLCQCCFDKDVQNQDHLSTHNMAVIKKTKAHQVLELLTKKDKNR